MSQRRRHGHRRQAWILVLILIDLALGSAMYAEHGGGPVVVALMVSLVLGALASIRPRRTSNRRR